MSLIGNKRVSSHYLCPKSLLVRYLCAFLSPMLFRVSLLLAGLVALTLAKDLVRVKRQTNTGTGLTFAIPGLNFLGGGIGNLGIGGNNRNIFGQQTFTRTLISTVSTVTQASYRTCTTSMAALMPCAGRRRREAGDELENDIEPTPAIALIIGTTTISNPAAVSEYLESHKPSSQSLIYPADYVPPSEIPQDTTTLLYPSDDTPSHDHVDDEIPTDITTELSLNDDIDEEEISTTETPAEKDTLEKDKARAGLLGTITTTTVIRVTSVATTIATGTLATLTVQYGGCLPPSLPITTNVCVP